MANLPYSAGRRFLSCYADCQTVHQENNSCSEHISMRHIFFGSTSYFRLSVAVAKKRQENKGRSNFWVDL